ncbi:MAG: type II toxin-antitoxin system VapC family toxin [Chthoniobacterales bacterium]
MNCLLDTHVFLWVLSDPDKLSPAARQAIENPDHTVYVSAVTAVEISIKAALGKLEAPAELSREIVRRGFTELPLKYTHGEAMRRLANHHTDPFDRMLIAQAAVENLVVITRDEKFRSYPIKILRT